MANVDVVYEGPSGKLVIDGKEYATGEVIPMTQSAYDALVDPEGSMATHGHRFTLLDTPQAHKAHEAEVAAAAKAVAKEAVISGQMPDPDGPIVPLGTDPAFAPGDAAEAQRAKGGRGK